MKIVLVSRNKKKIRELKNLLNIDIDILSLDDIGYFEEIAETGNTFEENSQIKATVAAKLGYIGIADDSGLEVDVLGGEPGVYTARYASENATDEQNNLKLMKELEKYSFDECKARFVSVIACVFPENLHQKNIISKGVCEGKISKEFSGENGFGYDPIFYYEPLKKTFAEMTENEKNSISHRGRAMEIFVAEFLKKINKNED